MPPKAGLDLNTILQKATQIIDENGLDQLSMGSLAKELNVRTPSLYNHLDGLNNLKQHLSIYGLKQLYDHMLQSVIGRSGDDAVKSLGEAYIQFARLHPGLYDATLRFTNPDDSDLQAAQHSIVQLIIQVLQGYGLNEEMGTHMVRVLRSVLHGFTSLEQMGGFRMQLDLDKSFSILIGTFIRGINSITDKEHEYFQEEDNK